VEPPKKRELSQKVPQKNTLPNENPINIQPLHNDNNNLQGTTSSLNNENQPSNALQQAIGSMNNSQK
jgi:hypothetical protein